MRMFLKFLYFMSMLFVSICNCAEFTKEKITFYSKKDDNSNERIARKGILVKRKNAPATVVICHGYGNNKFAVAPFRIFFRDYNSLTFDFRAHGEQIEDQCCTVGHDEVYDLFGAIDFIKSQADLKDKPVLIWAPSMGAATAIEAQAMDPNLCIGMFLDAPFPSSEDIIKQGIAKMKLGVLGYEFDLPGSGLLSRYAFNSYVQPVLKYLLKKVASLDATKIETFVKPVYPIESIKKVKIPCFFAVCKNDEKISVKAVTQIYKNHPGPKKLWITNGRDHCDSVFYDPEKYEKMVNDFFKSVLNGKIHKEEKKEIVLIDKDE
jgi:uncharacterized protein